MPKILNFDMDGTLANLYAVDNWLDKLRAYDAAPYADAAPLVRLSTLARYIHKAQANGWKVNIISWLSKEPTPDYDAAVTAAKIDWLKRHLPSVDFDAIIIVPYGTPKHELSEGVLFDDELPNRTAWNAANADNHAFDEDTIFSALRVLLAE